MAEGLVLQVGRYGLFGAIAAGGMAEVHLGRLAGTGGFQKTIAIKRLLPHISRNPDFRTMILEEARIASRIRHPNVVQPLDVITTDDEVLLAMEYVHGEALSKLIMGARKRGEKVPPSVGMAIMCETLHGLHAAHEAKDEQGAPLGIVHRDVSPQNVIVGADGVARVIDFGIAKAVTSTDSTMVGQVKGKLPYIAPEQFAGESATRLCDIYAAGCIAWEVLVGRRLFEGDTDQAIAARILRAPIDPPSSFSEDVPPGLDEVILRSIDRDPSRRFQTAREMALAIEQVIPIATASTVGAFVEHLAEAELRKRAEQLARVERLPFDFTPEPMSSRRTMPPNLANGPVMPHTIALPRQTQAPGQSAPPPPPFAPPSPPPQPPPPDLPPANSVRPPAWKSEVKPPAAGVLRKPEIEIPNVAWLPDDGAKAITITKPRKLSGTMFMLVLFLIVGAGFIIALPTIVRRGFEKSAAAQGMILTIADAQVSRRDIKLLGVDASIPELPFFSAHASAVTVDLAGIDPRAFTVHGLEIKVDGALPDLVQKIDRYRAAHKIGAGDDDAHRAPKFTIDGARVTWTGALGKTTTVLGENVTFEAYGDDDVTHATAALVTVKTAAGTSFGPVRVDYERSPLETRVWLRFDTSGARATSVVLAFDPTGAVTLDANIPRSRAEELFLPPSLGVSELALNIQAKLVPGKKGEGRINAYALAGANDIRFDALLASTDETQPLGVITGNAQVAVVGGAGPVVPQKLRPGGTLSFNAQGIDLSFFAVCDSKPDASIFTLAFDTHDPEGTARVAVAKDPRCGGRGK